MKTILVVDDELGLAEALCSLLAIAGYDAEKAWNGQLALEKIAAKQPVLIITDLMMPIMDGHELLRALQQNADWCNIPVIVMSAAASFDTNEFDKTAGFLAKPFEIDAFFALVRRVIGPPEGASRPPQ